MLLAPLRRGLVARVGPHRTWLLGGVPRRANQVHCKAIGSRANVLGSLQNLRLQHSSEGLPLLPTLPAPASLGRYGTMATTNPQNASQRIDLSLDRIQALLKTLGDPHHAFPVIHVAGTNAKGSTIAYLDAILSRVVGVRTGSFTSPHLATQRDSCRVAGQTVDETIWHEAGAKVDTADAQSAKGPACTPFELLTARCFVAFSLLPFEARPQVLLIEVGMGGSLDATNVFTDRQVLASVIGAIDLDHQSFLGDTLGKIARHKAGIVKPRGLCVLADQRRSNLEEKDGDMDVTRIPLEPSWEHLDAAQEVVQSVRATCADRDARLVLSSVPWSALTQDLETDAKPSLSMPGAVFAESVVRFTPILSPSKVNPGAYVAGTGDNIVPGPRVKLPITRASLMGAHLALQTLWSIARDENSCGLGLSGSDSSEDLRLAIAFALRDDKTAHEMLRECVEMVQLAGRAEWQTIQIPVMEEGPATETTVADHKGSLPASQMSVSALIDGAHNAAAALALGHYVDKCVRLPFLHGSTTRNGDKSQHVATTVTWILAFSQGKEVAPILANLLDPHGQNTLQEHMRTMAIDRSADNGGEASDIHKLPKLRHRVAFVPFSTPVEGMPWVKPQDPAELAVLAAEWKASGLTSLEDVQHFSHTQEEKESPLVQALRWAQQDPSNGLVVIAGSLYLVSDAHRLIQGTL